MAVTFSGISIEESFSHLLKQDLPILVRFVESEMDSNALQLLNTLLPREVTVSGIFIDLRELQYAKTLESIIVIPSGNLTEDSFEHWLKA